MEEIRCGGEVDRLDLEERRGRDGEGEGRRVVGLNELGAEDGMRNL